MRSHPILSPSANQLYSSVGYGQENGKASAHEHSSCTTTKIGVLQHTQTQFSYNTDCCGYSVQYRRFSFGDRNENQFRVAFAVANIGSFGTLRRQERMF